MKSKYFGFTYMGSKNKLSNFLIKNVFLNQLDKDYMLDLFSGGLSVASIGSNSPLQKIFANDLNKYVIAFEKMFLREKNIPKEYLRFIRKNDFEFIRDNPFLFEDEYVGFVLMAYSFGCDQRTYLYAKDIEEPIEAIHNILAFNDYTLADEFDYLSELKNILKFEHENYLENPEEKTVELRVQLKEFISNQPNKIFLRRIDEMKHLNIYRSMKKMLKNIVSEKIELSSMDYLEFYKSVPKEILEKSFIYCDPPYESTKKYPFIVSDYDEFWKFFKECPYPVYVSSYNAPPDIKPFAVFKTVQYMDNGNDKIYREKEKSVVFENIYYNGK